MLEVWHVWCVFGIILFILELFAPMFFCLNLAIAAFPAAIAAYYHLDATYQILIFGAFAGMLLKWFRPLLVKKQKQREDLFKSKYMGQYAKALEEITMESGRIAVFDEEWEARARYKGEDLPKGRKVEIKDVKDMIMYVDNIIDHSELDYKVLSDGTPSPSNGLVDEPETLD